MMLYVLLLLQLVTLLLSLLAQAAATTRGDGSSRQAIIPPVGLTPTGAASSSSASSTVSPNKEKNGREVRVRDKDQGIHVTAGEEECLRFWNPWQQLPEEGLIKLQLQQAPAYFATFIASTSLSWFLPPFEYHALCLAYITRAFRSSNNNVREFAGGQFARILHSPITHSNVVSLLLRKVRFRLWRRVAARIEMFRILTQLRLHHLASKRSGLHALRHRRARRRVRNGAEAISTLRPFFEDAAVTAKKLEGLYPVAFEQIVLVAGGLGLPQSVDASVTTTRRKQRWSLRRLQGDLGREFGGDAGWSVSAQAGDPKADGLGRAVLKQVRRSKVRLKRTRGEEGGVGGGRGGAAEEEEHKIRVRRLRLHYVSPIAFPGSNLTRIHQALLDEGIEGRKYRAVIIKQRNLGQQLYAKDDVKSLSRLLNRLVKNGWLNSDCSGLIQEMKSTSDGSFDLEREGACMERIRENLRTAGLLDTTVRVPEVVKLDGLGPLSSQSVLVITTLRGVRVADKYVIEHAVAHLEGERRKFINKLYTAFGQMVLVDGLFPSNPQPGNLLYMNDGCVGLLDLGVVSAISDHTRQGLCALYKLLAEQQDPPGAPSPEREDKIRAALTSVGLMIDLPKDQAPHHNDQTSTSSSSSLAASSPITYDMIARTLFDTQREGLPEYMLNPLLPGSALGRISFKRLTREITPLLRLVAYCRGICAHLDVDVPLSPAFAKAAKKGLQLTH